MGNIVVQAENVSKKYKIGRLNADTLKDSIKHKWNRLFRDDEEHFATHEEDFWALRNINFEVERGDIMGIIGKNGAGKSTLLKLLSRITSPTEGKIKMKGRVASLLEVGTGFHPELTGRENIYLNATILGMRESEVRKIEDEIISFAEIEDHIDTPIKHYSSGMRVRLGFSVAAHLNPDIVILDEVLSVGDADFQRKSMAKMRSIAQSGRTVFFVSHSLNSIQNLCNKAIYLKQGQLIESGLVDDVVDVYKSTFKISTDVEVKNHITFNFDDAPGNELVKLQSAYVKAKDKGLDDPINMSDDIEVSISFWKLVEEGKFDVGIQVFDIERDLQILGSNSHMCELLDEIKTPNSRINFQTIIPKFQLNASSYYLNIVISDMEKKAIIFNAYCIAKFTIENITHFNKYRFLTKSRGIIRPLLNWNINIEK
ncbi:MAG: polysaccharide ABC transporter ATP-binding protein [Chitinophagales bacterium]|nr:ATP-binding cassette domain-containing protein [Bacteroidota bacterium]MCB9042748.1 ATP-binding cassette domain-containing protein [Chitinophagales bacterium]